MSTRVQPIDPSKRTPHDQDILDRDFVEIYICHGCEGDSIVVNDRRVGGPKAWGGGTVGQQWTARKTDVLAALGLEEVTGGDERADDYLASLHDVILADGAVPVGSAVIVPLRPKQVGREGQTIHGVLEGTGADSGGDYGTVRFLDGNVERWSLKSVLVVGRMAETVRP